jgi:thiol-disulfide isomerase/thioredoxin
MYVRKGLFGLLLLLALVISACGGAAPAPEAAVKGAEAVVEEDASGTVVEAGRSDAMTDLPAWFGAQLTDVHTGETLTVSDLKGKVVLVETMAIWCPNCLRQQQEVKALHEALGERDDLVTLVLDVDPNEDAGDLKAYATRNGFKWTYSVAPPEVAREIGQLYGDQFLNPPSTPMFIVDRHSQVHLLPFGRKTAGDLQEALTPFLSEGM